jgi:hypothetical protein
MRNQAFIVAATGVLALSMSGCGNDSGSNTASPSPSVSPTTNAVASATPSPPGKGSFSSPMVSPSPEGVAPPPGLTGATNPDDRVKQLETGLAPLTTKKPASVQVGLSHDPFALLPPQPIQGPDKANGTKKDGGLPKFPELKIPTLPLLPTNARPPQILVASQPTTQLPTDRSPITIPKLPLLHTNRSPITIPQLPTLPTNARPPQIGGTKLTGADLGQIRLSPLAQSVVNEFRTFNSLLDDTTKYSDYNKDLNILRVIIYGEKEDSRYSTRRQLLLTNRPLFRRLEKAIAEYENAEELWQIYGATSKTDDNRCSVQSDIKEAIDLYQPKTEKWDQILCVKRIDMLQSVWKRGQAILNAALRDQDYQGPLLVKSPSLPLLAASQPKAQPPSDALARAIPGLPQVPGINPPAVGRPVSIPSLTRGGRSIPGITISPPPSLPVASKPIGIPGLPPLPVDKRPAQWRDTRPRPTSPGLPSKPNVPPPPSTELAQGLEVTGVVTVGNETQIIVKAPDESTSRYIKVGQRVANGKVLIKRVELRPGSEPIVIVEQNGIEVAKSVGATSPKIDPKSANKLARS